MPVTALPASEPSARSSTVPAFVWKRMHVAPATAAVGELTQVLRVLKNVGNVDGKEVQYRYYASANALIKCPRHR